MIMLVTDSFGASGSGRVRELHDMMQVNKLIGCDFNWLHIWKCG
jgi:hypothetical protein